MRLSDFEFEGFAYTLDNGMPVMRWNISQAIEAVARGEIYGVTPVDLEQMHAIAERNDFNEATLPHVDPNIPGIAAHINVPGDGPGTGRFAIMIDGTHRCVEALREGRGFSVAVLTDEAARACMFAGLKCAP